MAKWKEIFNSRYCTLPICNCELEKQIKEEHKLYHFLDRTKYYAGRCDRRNLVCPDEPLDILEEKRKHQRKLDAEECRAYMPLMYDRVSPCEIFEENDIRIEDSVRRTAQRSTLTNMLPLRPIPVKKKDSDWGSYQDMSRDYSTLPQRPETYISMMTRFTDEMIIAKIPDFRSAASIGRQRDAHEMMQRTLVVLLACTEVVHCHQHDNSSVLHPTTPTTTTLESNSNDTNTRLSQHSFHEASQGNEILPRMVDPNLLSVPLSFLLEATNEILTSPHDTQARLGFGKNSFLTGFGLGFLAFGLKKLLLPFFIGAQIVKSVLVALFLPTILSHIGKLVGKGLTNVATQSGSSGAHDQITEFEFKDPVGGAAGYDAEASGSEVMGNWIIPQAQSNAHATLAALNPGRTPGFQLGVLPASAQSNKPAQTISERYTPKLPPIKHFGSFYSKDPHSDFKIFNKIPNSSQLLAHYDPFYSPLLSRLDSVFKQLGTTSEGCRERLVCDMYKNPAKFAPFSNLVSAQLSRELNELRKPSSDNPEILRFFRYMKAAKDGQDGTSCETVHTSCIAPTKVNDHASPMVTTFNDINKLVQARSIFH